MAIEIAPLTAPRSIDNRPPRIVTSSAAALPAVLKVVAVLLFLPEEASFDVAGLRLTAIRVAFLVLTPVVLARLVQKVIAGRYRFVLSDLFVPLAGVWMIVGPANVIGIGEAVSHGGPIALEFCVGYLVTRVLLSTHGQALSFVDLLCRVIAIVALLGLADPLTHHFLIRDLVGKLTGYSKGFTSANYDVITRMGVLRAASTLEHPIAFGLVCAIGLFFSAYLPLRGRKFTILSCGIGVIISITSAAFQGVFLAVTLLLYGRIMAGARFRWLALISLGVVVIFMVFMLFDNPFGVVFRHLTFDAQDGYYRLYVWQVAGVAVVQSPWFGIGFLFPEYYEIPYTVDSVWLQSALTFGIPGSLLIGLSLVGSASLPTNGRRAFLSVIESRLGTMLGIVIFLVIFWGFTVHYWGIDWILIALLIGIRAHLGELGRIGPPGARFPSDDASSASLSPDSKTVLPEVTISIA